MINMNKLQRILLSIDISAMQLAVIPVLAILAGLGLRAELTERR